MAMLNPMMTTDVAGNPCWMRPGGWTQVGILKTMGCMGSVVKPHKWLLLKRPWEFVKELFRTYLSIGKEIERWKPRDLFVTAKNPPLPEPKLRVTPEF
jgi:hypothetical protein